MATLAILDKLGLPGNEDLQLLDPPHQGTAIEQYKELENLYRSEKGREGVDPKGRGVQVLLEAATKNRGGLLQLYHEDFKNRSEDTRKPVPWEMFKDYVEAAIKHAKFLEKREKIKQAKRFTDALLPWAGSFLTSPADSSS